MIDPAVDGFLPPALFALLAFGFLVAGRHRVAAVALVVLVLFASIGVPHLLITPLLLPASEPPTVPPGAIVVLASGLPELLDTSRTAPSIETLRSLRTAAALSRATGTPILVSGARAATGPTPVATQMAQSLANDFQVPATWTETKSVNLWQSAVDSAAILRDAGVSRIDLVGQPWELRLSMSVFQAAGLIVTPAPIPHAALRRLDASALVIVTPAWLDSALALRQWAGLACQAVTHCSAWMRTQTAQE